MALKTIYSEKSKDYYEQARDDIISLIPEHAKRILDIGCGTGTTGAKLKEFIANREIFGIEYLPDAAEIAKQRLDRVVVGDIENIVLEFPEGYFDCIRCADVLEHCQDPWSVLHKLRSLLSQTGVLVASIPNIRHITVILKIIFDRWEYEASGILDKTHLRFFTLHTMKKMFQAAGFEILKKDENRSRSWKFRLLNLISLGLLKPLFVYQYLFVVRKKT